MQVELSHLQLLVPSPSPPHSHRHSQWCDSCDFLVQKFISKYWELWRLKGYFLRSKVDEIWCENRCSDKINAHSKLKIVSTEISTISVILTIFFFWQASSFSVLRPSEFNYWILTLANYSPGQVVYVSQVVSRYKDLAVQQSEFDTPVMSRAVHQLMY